MDGQSGKTRELRATGIPGTVLSQLTRKLLSGRTTSCGQVFPKLLEQDCGYLSDEALLSCNVDSQPPESAERLGHRSEETRVRVVLFFKNLLPWKVIEFPGTKFWRNFAMGSISLPEPAKRE
jgi:hypothetical protein